ncbi:MAG: helix-turn-helix transcriptional regulator, partial [Planctomycetaceae bacterium]
MLDRSLPANGERIRTLRKEEKLTQSDLAIKVGIDKHSIENAEAGRNIRETNLQRIAKALGVSLDDIVRPEQCETAPAAKRPREHSEASVSSDAGQNETSRDGFRIFGFGERSLAIDLLVHWQKKLK